MPSKKKKSHLTKAQKSEVRSLAKATTLRLAETKQVGKIIPQTQLFHNLTVFHGPYLAGIKKGLNDPTLQTNNTARVGDEILLKSFEQRYWLSNKYDRPNVMYRITTFWFPSNAGLVATAPKPTDVYFYSPTLGTAPNIMICRTNNEVIKVISDKMVFSENNYAQPYYNTKDPLVITVAGKERSQLRTINKNWKARKVKYLDSGVDGVGSGGPPKNADIWVAVTAYDAYGTLITDNLASFALNPIIKFKDL